jgi:DNA replication protein DnaC
MLLANIGKKYWRASVDDIPENYGLCRQLVFRYVEDILQNIRDGVGLLFYGPKGHGKTYIAIAVLKRALLYNARGLYLPVCRLQEVVIERNTLSEDDEVSMFERARAVDVLILDDLGEEYTKDFSTRMLENLCRYRSNRGLTTLFTTNLTPADGELGHLYGDWIESVLKEMAHPVMVKGKDWRVEKARQMQQRLEG